MSDKSCEYPCTHGAIIKVVAGDTQPEAVFGYFYPADGGVGEE